MSTYVLDTNVAIAWYIEESFSKSAVNWQERMFSGEVQFVVPSLHRLEFGNVLRTLVKRTGITPQEACEIYSLHSHTPLLNIDPSPESLLDTALEYNATVYDASFIQLVLEEQIPLLTAERRTREWVRKLGNLAIHVK